MIGVGVDVLRGFALVLILSAGLSLFIALYNALAERRYDLALMRTLGASPGKLMALMLFEGVLLAGLGAVARARARPRADRGARPRVEGSAADLRDRAAPGFPGSCG